MPSAVDGGCFRQGRSQSRRPAGVLDARSGEWARLARAMGPLTPPDAAICNSKYTAKALPTIFLGIPFDVIYLPVRNWIVNRKIKFACKTGYKFGANSTRRPRPL